MANFFGVENGTGATGYIVVNGNVYPATSGSAKYQDVPAGTYGVSDPEQLSAKQATMTGQPRGTKTVTAAQRAPFRKFHVIGTGDQGNIWDPRDFWSKNDKGKMVHHPNGGWRKGVELHYDGGAPGTEGCIGYLDPAVKDQLIADPSKSVTVQYAADDAANKAAIEKYLGHKVNWDEVKPKPPAPIAAAPQSKNKKGKKVTKAQTSVRVGKKQRYIAHKHAELEGGTKVAEGNPTIFVGRGLDQVARVEHMTTDGSPLATGDETVMLS